MNYNVQFDIVAEQISPPIVRKPSYIAWITVLVSVIQGLWDRIFNLYVLGSTAAAYDPAVTYVVDDRVLFTDRGVYKCILSTTGNAPTNIVYWIKDSDNYIGARERVMYNSQKILFEWALNRNFMWPHIYQNYPLHSTGIYIENTPILSNAFLMANSGQLSSVLVNKSLYAQAWLINTPNFSFHSCFTIWVPYALWTPMGISDAERENIVRNYADDYVISGIQYSVLPY